MNCILFVFFASIVYSQKIIIQTNNSTVQIDYLSFPFDDDIQANISGIANFIASDGCGYIEPVVSNNLIAIIERGNCTFVEKIVNAENANYLAVVIYDNIPHDPIYAGGDCPDKCIYSAFISLESSYLINNNSNIGDGELSFLRCKYVL